MTVQTKITFEVDYDSDEFENVNITKTLPQCDARWPDLLTLFADMLNEAEFFIDVENLNKVLEDYQKKQVREWTTGEAIQSAMGMTPDDEWEDNLGYQPVPDDTIVEVMFEDGDTDLCYHYVWGVEESIADIIKWRVAE